MMELFQLQRCKQVVRKLSVSHLIHFFNVLNCLTLIWLHPKEFSRQDSSFFAPEAMVIDW
jgi:hypothetical protein